MTKRAVIYGRVSYDDRDTDGRNLKGQLDMGREFVTKKGYALVDSLPEDARGTSGAEIDLPQLNKIRQLAADGEFDVLVVREIDRLSRNLAKQLIVEEELKRAGVRIEYVIGEYPDTPEGNLMKHVKASVAEYEREKINERMTRGRRQAAAAGSVMVFQRPPYGYRVVVDEIRNRKWFTLAVEPCEADVVRLIYMLYTDGDGAGPLPIYAIAGRLTQMGLPTAGDTNARYGRTKKLAYGHWSTSSIANILKKETYCGTWHYGKDDAVAVAVPAVIERELFERAAAIRARNMRNYTREKKHEYLLAGHLKCMCGYALCGTPNHVHGKTYLYYRCAAHLSREVETPCRVGNYQVPAIDAKVWEWVYGFLSDPEILEETLRAAKAQGETTTAPQRVELAVTDDLIAKRNDELKRLKSAYEAGYYTLEELGTGKARIESVLAGLKRERGKTVARIATEVITDDRIQRIMALAGSQADKVAIATGSFAVRRVIIEELELAGIVERADGLIKIHVTCLLGEEDLSLASTSTSGSTCPTTAGWRSCATPKRCGRRWR